MIASLIMYLIGMVMVGLGIGAPSKDIFHASYRIGIMLILSAIWARTP